MTDAAILRAIPHRPPFLFIDRIVSEDESGATAVRTVRAEEPQFEGHYPGNPIMPGVLLCEAVFQTAAYYLVGRIEKRGGSIEGLTPVLSRIRDARFKRMVKPGDEIEIRVDHLETVTKFEFLKGTVRLGGKTALTLEFALALIEEQDG